MTKEQLDKARILEQDISNLKNFINRAKVHGYCLMTGGGEYHTTIVRQTILDLTTPTLIIQLENTINKLEQEFNDL